MAMTRNQEHYLIMTVIYDELDDFIHGQGKVFRDARELISETAEVPYEEISPFVKKMIAESLNNYGAIIKAFEPFLKNWKWDRLPLLTQAILIMSYSHFYYVEKVAKRIVIDIAIELAKKYIDDKQQKFINAILDGVLQ